MHKLNDQMSDIRGEQSQNPPGGRPKGRAQQRGARTNDTNYYEGRFSEEEDRESEFLHQRHGARDRGGRNREDSNLDSIKMKIPAFQGRSDLGVYMEWEKKME